MAAAERVQRQQQAAGQGEDDKGQQAPAGFTPEALAQAFKLAGLGGAQQGGQVTTQPQMTQEQFDQQFHVFKMTPELLAGLSAEEPEKRTAAWNQAALLMVRNAAAVAAHFVQIKEQELNERYQPALTMAQELQYERIEKKFYTSNPDLKGHESLVNMAANHLKASGFNGTIEDGMKKTAEAVKAVLKNLPAAPTKNGTTNGQKQAATTKMSTVTTGGQGGASSAGRQDEGNGARVNPLAKSLFGSRR